MRPRRAATTGPATPAGCGAGNEGVGAAPPAHRVSELGYRPLATSTPTRHQAIYDIQVPLHGDDSNP